MGLKRISSDKAKNLIKPPRTTRTRLLSTTLLLLVLQTNLPQKMVGKTLLTIRRDLIGLLTHQIPLSNMYIYLLMLLYLAL